MARPWEISADDIVTWASSASAAATLPKLVRRLLFATAPLRSLVMRADSGIHLAGWDGVVESTRDTAFCPAGTSYWELSVHADIKKKLDRDFQKRSDKRAADAVATYVAVTARRFPGKEKWVHEKEQQGAFAAVLALDADDLATWLEQSPPVARWFASMLDRPAAGGDDIETFLSLWERRTAPPLPSELALAGREREETASRLRGWLSAPPSSPCSVRGDTREEALIFVAATIASRGSPESEQWLSRALVIKDLETWTWLTQSRHAEPPILLPAFQEFDRGHAEHATRSMGAHVIVPLDATVPADIEAEVLEPIPYPRIADQLTRAGIADAEAERIARECGGRLAALQRIFGHLTSPDWDITSDHPPLLAMLLVGAWDPSSNADREVIGRLGGDPRAVENLCARLSSRPDAPIEREVSWGRKPHWKWVAPRDAWRALARYLTDSHLTSFRDVATDVLGERDPRYELPKNGRLYAAIQGKVTRRSDSLRGGVAQSLVRLALSDQELRASFQPSCGSQLASLVVSQLLDNDWQTWASLSVLLPVIAEASPPTFLECVERSLDRGSPGVIQLLQEEERAGRSPHTGLLGALEVLGWGPDFMPRVAYALARLALHDPPGAQLANRPIRSLNDLIHPLRPQSRTTVEERIETLSTILGRRSTLGNIGWRMAISQYKGLREQGVLFRSHRPEYQLWELPSEQHESSPSDVERQLDKTVELLLKHVGSNPDRWKDLLDLLWKLSVETADSILDRLDQSMNAVTDLNNVIWTSLRHRLSTGYHFREPRNTRTRLLQRIEQLYRDFTPVDAVARIAWLFDNRSELPEPMKDWPDHQARKQELQQGEIAQLWSTENRWELLATLISVVDQKYLIGGALGAINSTELDERLLKGPGDERFSPVIPLFVWVRANTLDMEWATCALKELVDSGRQADALAIVLARYSDPALWDAIDSIGDPLRAEYWAKAHVVFGVHSTSDADRALQNLIAAGNAIEAARFAAHKPNVVAPIRALEILEAVRRSESSHLDQFWRDSDAAYVIEYVFGITDRDTQLDISAIALLELFFFPLLEHSSRGARHLFAALSEDPHLFVSLLIARYKTEDEAEVESSKTTLTEPEILTSSDTEESVLKRRKAETAYHLLTGWPGFPGNDLPPSEREAKLLAWAEEALQLSSRQRRKAMGELEVAKVLARVPVAPKDELWPCLAARKLLETGAYGSLGGGLFEAKRNSWWGSFRALGNGQEERALAAEFRTSAKKLRIHWARTASLLDRLAESFERDAEELDANARTERRHWDVGIAPQPATDQPQRDL